VGEGERAQTYPLAALVVWRGDRIEAAVGAVNVFAVAEPVETRLWFSEAEADLAEEGRELSLEELRRFPRRELAVRLRDGSDDPYLGLTFWAGQFFVIASPAIPWQEYACPDRPSAVLRLPDLRVLEGLPETWVTRDDTAPITAGPPRALPQLLPQQTFQEARTLAMAIADGPTGRHWEAVEGELALRHAPPGSPLQTKLVGGSFLDWLLLPAAPESLAAELRRLELPAVLLLHVVLALVLERPEPATVTLDDLIRLVGWQPRGAAARAGMRRTLWRWLLLFHSMPVIGKRRGQYRDPLTKQSLDLAILDPLLHVSPTRFPPQHALDDSEPPLEVSLKAGPWLERFRGNRQVLSDFGDVRRIAAIPAGKPAGAWAQAVGLALQQRWRERASRATVARAGDDGHATVRLDPAFTRRDLLGLFRCAPDVEEILRGKNPSRARQYWRETIALLREARIVGFYRERETLPLPRQGWQQAWLDQPLDIRPAADGSQAAAAIAGSADRARKRRTSRSKRGR
jgi:hypothetical protein